MPLERRITLKFQHREGFVNEYAANISLKGMFITAWVPEPCGSVFLFEVQVADRQLLIHGVGEVVWVREAEESPERPSGMGVRFLKLDEASREVINGMVETPCPARRHAVRSGGRGRGRRSGGGRALRQTDRPAGGRMARRPDEAPASRTLVLDPRLRPFEGRAMARRGRRGALLLWATLGPWFSAARRCSCC